MVVFSSAEHMIGIHAMISSISSTGKGGIGILLHAIRIHGEMDAHIKGPARNAHLLRHTVRLNGEAEGSVVDGRRWKRRWSCPIDDHERPRASGLPVRVHSALTYQLVLVMTHEVT